MYLQESKIKSDLNSENITCFHTREDAYGLWFIINEKWKNSMHNQFKGKCKITILQLNPLNIKEPSKYTNLIYKQKKLVKGLRMKMKIENKCNMITTTRFYVLRDGRNPPPPIPQLPKYLTIHSAWKNSPSVESSLHCSCTIFIFI